MSDDKTPLPSRGRIARVSVMLADGHPDDLRDAQRVLQAWADGRLGDVAAEREAATARVLERSGLGVSDHDVLRVRWEEGATAAGYFFVLPQRRTPVFYVDRPATPSPPEPAPGDYPDDPGDPPADHAYEQLAGRQADQDALQTDLDAAMKAVPKLADRIEVAESRLQRLEAYQEVDAPALATRLNKMSTQLAVLDTSRHNTEYLLARRSDRIEALEAQRTLDAAAHVGAMDRIEALEARVRVLEPMKWAPPADAVTTRPVPGTEDLVKRLDAARQKAEPQPPKRYRCAGCGDWFDEPGSHAVIGHGNLVECGPVEEWTDPAQEVGPS